MAFNKPKKRAAPIRQTAVKKKKAKAKKKKTKKPKKVKRAKPIKVKPLTEHENRLITDYYIRRDLTPRNTDSFNAA